MVRIDNSVSVNAPTRFGQTKAGSSDVIKRIGNMQKD
jgi:hypothetical protein